MSIDERRPSHVEWPEDDYQLSDEGWKRMSSLERDLVSRAGMVRTNRRRRQALTTSLLLVATVAGLSLLIDDRSSHESSQKGIAVVEPTESIDPASPIVVDEEAFPFPERTRPRMVVVRRSGDDVLPGVKTMRVDANSMPGVNIRHIDDSELMRILIETRTAAAIRCRDTDTGPSCELALLDSGRG